MDCSLPGSSVHEIVQARILEWVTFPSPGDLPDPGIKSRYPALQVDSLLSETREAQGIANARLFTTAVEGKYIELIGRKKSTQELGCFLGGKGSLQLREA